MMLSVPGNKSAMCVVGGPPFRPGTGPVGFGLDVSPFPLATSRCLPSGVTRTEVGYQPTGMNPSERALRTMETSKTAMLLLQALATNRSVSSGESARLLGVEPGRSEGESDAQRVCLVLPSTVSMTLTELRLALATNK